MRLANKVVIITGAGSGFGEGIAERFSAERARVAVVDLRGDAGGGVVLNIGSTAGVRPRPGLTWYNATKGR